ncbi:MAG: hypothetical protein Q8M08_15395 [Bacteroidales bacterium]|nr:hypothetical protein [Bacteroidales bacterium]
MKQRLLDFFIKAQIILMVMFASIEGYSQVSNTGCVSAQWGIDAGLYSGIVEYGAGTPALNSNDWFLGPSGHAVIDQTDVAAMKALLQAPGNPTYLRTQSYPKVSIVDGQILVDAVFARDHFGGTGFIDPTSYNTASKNGEDPAIWDPGPANVLGKNDIIDIAGHMFRSGGTNFDDLWFVGLFNMAEPGGTSYMDFEFYVQSVSLVPKTGGGIKFTSGGPQLGHTAYNFVPDPLNPGKHKISKVGDFIFSVALEAGTGTVVETRIWVSRTDWMNITPLTFNWAGTFDGAFNGSPYGYAGIVPLGSGEICGYVNAAGQTPLAPPWGTKNTKTNTWGTTYQPYSLAEVGINLTALGMDHSSLSGADPCYFPLNTYIIKTRASASFTAQLKDFAGPYGWGQPDVTLSASDPYISCDVSLITITANPQRSDVTYAWSTLSGNIVSTPNPWEIIVNKPGTYTLTVTLPTNCPIQVRSITIPMDLSKPFFNEPPVITKTVSCNGNDGSITVTVTGATPPYTFSWTKDGSPYTTTANPTITGLAPGTYAATIKGTYACEITTGGIIMAPRIPVIITPSLTHAACFGFKNGAVNLSISGGQTPLSYLWSTGNTSQNLLNIGAGGYTVTVTDADGCMTVGNYTITEPTAISATIVKTNDTDPDPLVGNGTITLTVTGGTPSYIFNWAGPGGFSSVAKDLTGLKYGSYSVTVTDASGCTKTASVFIYEPEICNDGIDNDGDGLNNCDDSDCIPPAPGTITPGNPTPCVGIAVTYTVPLFAYDSYLWAVPANATLNSGQGTNSIYVTWTSTAGGQICVKGKIYDCLSSPSCISVSVSAVPPTPGTVTIENN